MLLGWLVYQERKDLPQDLARQLKAALHQRSMQGITLH